MREPEADDSEAASDADLVLRSRSGDSDAFGELWQRHYRSAVVAAKSISPGLDPDDLAQESYAKIFQAIRRGGGPTGSFRAYLFTAIRNTAAAWGKARHEVPADELDSLEDPDTSDAAVDAALDRSLTTTAFRSLPSRWQEVLWYSEVEAMKPAEIAPLLGMKPAAVSQLAFRAREGLREAWIQAHIAAVGDGSACHWTIERLGAYARGNLGPRDTTKLDAHLADCPRCTIVAAEAADVGSRLVLVLLPLAVGVTGAAGYLATLQRGGEAVALMAMPDGVLTGASVVGDQTVSAELIGHGAELFGHAVESGAAIFGAIAAGAGATAASAGSSSGASTGASAGASAGSGAFTIAGVVAAGAASLLVAGMVAAAAVLPSDAFDNTAGEQHLLEQSVPAAAEIEPDDALAARELDDDYADDAVVPDAPAPDEDARDQDAPPEADRFAAPEPADETDENVASTPSPVPDEVAPSAPAVRPTDPAPDPEPGQTAPPAPAPEPTDPEPTPSPEPTPTPEPELPTEPEEPAELIPLAFVSCVETSENPKIYDVTLSGTPNATVHAYLDTGTRAEKTVDEFGFIEFKVTLPGLIVARALHFHYEDHDPTTAGAVSFADDCT